jgi:hypothetical protein
MINNFVPAVRKIMEQVEDIKTHRVYLEKTRFDEKRLTDTIQAMNTKMESYVVFLTNIAKSMNRLPSEKEPNIQRVKENCDKIIEANKKLVEDYKYFSNIVPPEEFSNIHQTYSEVYLALFEVTFRFADDIERITTLSVDQLDGQ